MGSGLAAAGPGPAGHRTEVRSEDRGARPQTPDVPISFGRGALKLRDHGGRTRR